MSHFSETYNAGSSKVSIIMPCFNEIGTIDAILNRVIEAPIACESEIVVVDDCSTDGTREFLKKLNKPHEIKIVFHDGNRGNGVALRTGFQHTTGNIIIIQDADLEYDPNDYPKLLTPILNGQADVVYGSRFVSGESHRVLYFWHSVGNRILTLISNMFTNLNLSDMEVGYKAFRKELLDRIELREDRFGLEPEITAKISRLECPIYEVGISSHGRTYEEGKKINWKDGLRAVYIILKYGLVTRSI